ncbi:mitochondrial genome maintenance exonuclease 1 [Megalops cyprinoides]|uniref:mitochondrial genome maintenance exonuclease 1 n=1 Tax=Megalops cyprinoides TaxID=118141 RepID=UPI0018651059|nr:mitochondrial genome maintenance exonuclease 1 [Megalops cyprinoides]
MRFCRLFRQVQHVGARSLVIGLLSYANSSLVAGISTSCANNARKRTSQYSTVDTEKYSSLVQSVVSSRTSSQTPASLEEEDGHIYGPVVKSKPATERSAPKAPKNPVPLLNHAKILDLTSEADSGPPTRIPLQRGPGKSSAPSVTRILQQTMSPEQAFYLERWRKMMIAQLGEEGFKEYSLNLFRQGKQFHMALEAIFMSEEVPATDTEPSELVAGYIESVQHVLEDISGVRAIESAVQHQSLNYLGMVDCVAQYRGKLCVIDWKTSEKPKPFLHNTYDNPLQVAAYIGALNSDEHYDYQVESGLIVVAYKDGSPAHPHFMTSDLCLEYWTKWLIRLEDFMERK